MTDKSKWFVLRKMIKFLDVSGLSLFLILNLVRPIKCFVPKSIFRMSAMLSAQEFAKIIATHLIQDWENIELSKQE